MTAVSDRVVQRLREAVGVIGKACAFLMGSALVTFILASPLVMLRASLMAPGSGPEETEIGHLAGAVGALAATALAIAFFEQGRLRDVGLDWRRADRHNLLLGLAGGAGGALLVTVLPIIVGAAELRTMTDSKADLHNFVYYLVVLFIGSFGEELTMRGYPFQILLRSIGLVPAIVLTSALFAALHGANPSATAATVANTFLFGAALGYAMWRSGSLWVPVGLHAAWNITLPLFGANLSGFQYRLTVYELNWRIPDAWSGGAYGPEGGFLASLALLGWFLWIAKAPLIRQTARLLKPRDPNTEEPEPARGLSASL